MYVHTNLRHRQKQSLQRRKISSSSSSNFKPFEMPRLLLRYRNKLFAVIDGFRIETDFIYIAPPPPAHWIESLDAAGDETVYTWAEF